MNDVKLHLLKVGFIPNYYEWTRHGEMSIHRSIEQPEGQENLHMEIEGINPYQQMVFDAAGPEFQAQDAEEAPNLVAQKLFDMLDALNDELWPWCKKYSRLSAFARLLNIKFENHMSERCFDAIMDFLKEVLLADNKIVDSFYSTKS